MSLLCLCAFVTLNKRLLTYLLSTLNIFLVNKGAGRTCKLIGLYKCKIPKVTFTYGRLPEVFK